MPTHALKARFVETYLLLKRAELERDARENEIVLQRAAGGRDTALTSAERTSLKMKVWAIQEMLQEITDQMKAVHRRDAEEAVARVVDPREERDRRMASLGFVPMMPGDYTSQLYHNPTTGQYRAAD